MQIRPNKLKHKLQNGELAFAVTGLYSTDEIDAFAPDLVKAGVDAIWFDGEHGPTTHHELGDLTRVCDLWNLTSIMRLGENTQSGIFRAFDRGAQTIVIPHIGSRAEAENLVIGGKFPPIGKRGTYLGRQGYGVEDYFKHVNDETMLVAMIENMQGVQNLDEILEVQEIDAFFIGAWDLAGDMGFLHNRNAKEVLQQVAAIIKKVRERNRIVGVFSLKQEVAQYVAEGAQFIMTVARPWIAEGANSFIKEATSRLNS